LRRNVVLVTELIQISFLADNVKVIKEALVHTVFMIQAISFVELKAVSNLHCLALESNVHSYARGINCGNVLTSILHAALIVECLNVEVRHKGDCIIVEVREVEEL
jgi:hypothetical protein